MRELQTICVTGGFMLERMSYFDGEAAVIVAGLDHLATMTAITPEDA
jgi:hypothetical protein